MSHTLALPPIIDCSFVAIFFNQSKPNASARLTELRKRLGKRGTSIITLREFLDYYQITEDQALYIYQCRKKS